MPYLTPQVVDNTNLPKALGKDMRLAMRVLKEKHNRFHPLINYYLLSKKITPVVVPSQDQLTGVPGTTKFDPLWGESMPPNATAWQQPHLSGNLATNENEQFLDPIQLHMEIRREAQEIDLKRWGFDKMRDFICYIPTIILDELGMTVQAGDTFDWDGRRIDVIQTSIDAFWKNTNIPIALVFNAETRRKGS